jgi:hypothetical protein
VWSEKGYKTFLDSQYFISEGKAFGLWLEKFKKKIFQLKFFFFEFSSDQKVAFLSNICPPHAKLHPSA